MAITQELCLEIEEYLLKVVQQKLNKYSPETDSMPFHYRLLGKGHMSMYSFVQSINTTLGTSVFEQIGAKIATENDNVEVAVGQYKLNGVRSPEAILAIEQIVDNLQFNLTNPNKQLEIEQILSVCKAGNCSTKVKKTVDLYLLMKDGREYYFDLKTAKPNKENFISLKKKMLEWVALRGSLESEKQYPTLASNLHTMIAIPYNPYAPKPYSRWTLGGLFSPNDLLVGEEFWNFLGGESTYKHLLYVFEIVGRQVQKEIEEKFLHVGSN